MFMLRRNREKNKMTKASLTSAFIILVAFAVYFGLPLLLNAMGLHAHYQGQGFDLGGRKALIITTSRGVLGDTGKKTCVYASEMTVPYYEFLDAKMQVDVASIDGGEIPIEPLSLDWPV